MKESLRLNQEANKKQADERASSELALLQKPVDQLTGYDIDRMSSDVYKQRMQDKKFVELINKK